MEELLIVNPGKRGKKRRKSSKRRSAKQRAATRKLVAWGKAHRGGKTRRRSRKSYSGVTTMKRRKSRRRSSKSRKGKRKSRSVTVRINPTAARRAVARRYSNPRRRLGGGRLGFTLAKIQPMVMSAFTGALGAVAMTSVLSRLPLPAMLVTGKVRYVTQGAVAIGVGMLAQMLGVRGPTAAKAAEGALTVTLNDAIKEVALDAGVNLGGMGYYLPAMGARAVPSRARHRRHTWENISAEWANT